MSIRQFRPMTAATRFRSVSGFDEITRDTPEKALLEPMKKSGGRNNLGHLTSRHRGGGHKRQYRKIDFKRLKDGVPAKVATIEYDPNRSCYIALIHYADGEKRYILAPQGLKVGAELTSGPGADIRPGNALALQAIPTGTVVHGVEMVPGQGARMGRAAGAAIQVVAKEGNTVSLRLPSGEVRMVRRECRATVGTLSNSEHQNVKVGNSLVGLRYDDPRLQEHADRIRAIQKLRADLQSAQ